MSVPSNKQIDRPPQIPTWLLDVNVLVALVMPIAKATRRHVYLVCCLLARRIGHDTSHRSWLRPRLPATDEAIVTATTPAIALEMLGVLHRTARA